MISSKLLLVSFWKYQVQYLSECLLFSNQIFLYDKLAAFIVCYYSVISLLNYPLSYEVYLWKTNILWDMVPKFSVEFPFQWKCSLVCLCSSVGAYETTLEPWTQFLEILYREISQIISVQFWLKSGWNNGHSVIRPCIRFCAHLQRNSPNIN
jgi:hypothetical protein